MNSISIVALLTIFDVTAIAQNGANEGPADASCLQLNAAVMTQTASGHVAEAEALLSTATAPGDERGQAACTGHVLGNMARTMAVFGNIAEAERLAERSVRILERLYPPDDWTLLRPLQILAAVRLESGETARAREAIRRIQSIRIKRPEDSAVVHATVGALLQIEGRRSEAEAEYHDAFRAWEEAGRGDSADAAALLQCLVALYLEEERLDEARQALDRSLAIFNRAKDVLPVDRIKFLDLRSVLHGRLGEWQQAEQDLRDALSMADREPFVDPPLLRWMLVNYSYVLRRNHHRREARSIEARRAALPADRGTADVVDLTDLLAEKKPAKKGSLR
jgi:tetratricopeptide (TPR) repeat protein